ncbi:UNVERIFIED_CONTAM: hypothetical protein GTU68_008452 [Idotea baltica]|nr:hypothetical protein [Idotea baltica]
MQLLMQLICQKLLLDVLWMPLLMQYLVH